MGFASILDGWMRTELSITTQIFKGSLVPVRAANSPVPISAQYNLHSLVLNRNLWTRRICHTFLTHLCNYQAKQIIRLINCEISCPWFRNGNYSKAPCFLLLYFVGLTHHIFLFSVLTTPFSNCWVFHSAHSLFWLSSVFRLLFSCTCGTNSDGSVASPAQ